MSCCCLEAYEREFSPRLAARNLRRYRRRGPLPSTRLLLEAIQAEGVAGKTLLDIGGGVGALSHELLQAGLERATQVDLSPAYLGAAREEAERRGHQQRMTFLQGDAAALDERLPAAEIVTLDRVICCYPDVGRLLSTAARHARGLVGLVYPRETWWDRAALAAANLTFRVRRCPFRVYLHPRRTVAALLRDHGFEQRSHRTTLLWQVALYRRAPRA